LILAVDGAPVNDMAGLHFRIGTKRPGESVPLTVLRDGAERTVTARVEPPPGDRQPDPVVLTGRHPLSGAAVAELTPALADQIGVDPLARGVVLAAVSGRSYAAAASFRRGDVVVKINGRAVTTLRQLEQALAEPVREITILRG